MSITMTDGLSTLISELDRLEGQLVPGARTDMATMLRDDAAKLSPQAVKALVAATVAERPYWKATPAPETQADPLARHRTANGGIRLDGFASPPSPTNPSATMRADFGFGATAGGQPSQATPAPADPRILPGGGVRF